MGVPLLEELEKFHAAEPELHATILKELLAGSHRAIAEVKLGPMPTRLELICESTIALIERMMGASKQAAPGISEAVDEAAQVGTSSSTWARDVLDQHLRRDEQGWHHIHGIPWMVAHALLQPTGVSTSNKYASLISVGQTSNVSEIQQQVQQQAAATATSVVTDPSMAPPALPAEKKTPK